jgi:hypothetical protein
MLFTVIHLSALLSTCGVQENQGYRRLVYSLFGLMLAAGFQAGYHLHQSYSKQQNPAAIYNDCRRVAL